MADSTDEDRWASLAADLGVDGSTPTTQATIAAPVDGAPKKRRRRRPRKAAPAEGAIAEPNDDVPGEPDDAPELTDREELSPDGTPKKRRRRRSRRKPGEANGDATEATDTVAVAEAVDDDDDAAEPVSVANLPSWQELIDGLHRP